MKESSHEFVSTECNKRFKIEKHQTYHRHHGEQKENFFARVSLHLKPDLHTHGHLVVGKNTIAYISLHGGSKHPQLSLSQTQHINRLTACK